MILSLRLLCSYLYLWGRHTQICIVNLQSRGKELTAVAKPVQQWLRLHKRVGLACRAARHH